MTKFSRTDEFDFKFSHTFMNLLILDRCLRSSYSFLKNVRAPAEPSYGVRFWF